MPAAVAKRLVAVRLHRSSSKSSPAVRNPKHPQLRPGRTSNRGSIAPNAALGILDLE